MQREIKKKTVTYGIAAVLLAVLFTAICFNFGFQPYIPPVFSQLKTFSSYEELESFLKTNMEQAKNFGEQYLSPFFRKVGEMAILDAETAPAHSTTNIQVAGVDEADIVKTDGEYLYVVSSNNVCILKAYPTDEAKVLSKITLNETYNIKIYVNGDKLAVLGGHFAPFRISYTYTGEAFVKVYDISNKTSPVLTRTLSLNGTLSGSRMIGNYVYATVNQLAVQSNNNKTDFEVALPKISIGETVKEVQATEIRYVNVSDVFYYFTTVIAVNIINDAQEPTYETFLTGSTACMYVSQSNMYLTVPNTSVWILPLEVGGTRDETFIYRVKLDEEKIVCEAEGAVSGYLLNQFSMDEYNGFFRIATTKWTNDGSKNNLYTLNMSLNIVGKLEGLAPSERIYSARFMGNRCYLVTFKQIDPFFVIDLSDPAEPKVLGELKIPGFSGYLHPYDEDHIIGIGKQDSNLKLSLFNVTNVTAPTETAKFIVQGEWSDSTVLMDHKAFLFDKSKQLLALPVSISWIEMRGDEYHTEGFWQCAYV
ncbi:MAG: beta-propeller domain-containing protein, partial [Candidatus Bathyarchaeia archaeon]|nr:beta-propeller domain-containing protein [Candidatus Bathyarchaeia archaeon]